MTRTSFNQLFVLDGNTGAFLKSVRVAYNNMEEIPMTLRPSGLKLYCPDEIGNRNDTVVTTIPTTSYAYGLALNTSRRYLYISHVVTPQLTVVDYEADTVIAQIPVHIDPRNGYPWIVWHPVVDKIFVDDLTLLNVVDCTTNRLETTIPHRLNLDFQPTGSCNLLNNRLYFTTQHFGAMCYIVDVINNRITDSLSCYSALGSIWNQVVNKA